MEDDLNYFTSKRRPQYFDKWKTTLPFFLQMEDDLNILENGRRPHFFQMEDDLNILENGRLF